MAAMNQGADGRQTCQRCQSRMRYQGKSEAMSGGHHRAVFYCQTCDARRYRG